MENKKLKCNVTKRRLGITARHVINPHIPNVSEVYVPDEVLAVLCKDGDIEKFENDLKIKVINKIKSSSGQ